MTMLGFLFCFVFALIHFYNIYDFGLEEIIVFNAEFNWQKKRHEWSTDAVNNNRMCNAI